MSDRSATLLHADCMDGYMAGYITWRRNFDNADYLAVRYGEAPPYEFCEGRKVVLIVDFSYKREQLTELAKNAGKVVVIDHHKTALEHLKDWTPPRNVELYLDETHSGAALTAKYFGSVTSPWLINYTEDRDLWRHQLPDTKEINAFLAASVMGLEPLEAFAVLEDLRGLSLKQAASIGRGALAQIESYVRACSRMATKVRFAGHANIPIVNIPKMMNSDVLEVLRADSPFAVGWYQDGYQVVFSLRSKGEFDVAALAERFGGGGHKNAAGFVRPFSEAWNFIYGDPEAYAAIFPNAVAKH